jgi:hypothetical protein
MDHLEGKGHGLEDNRRTDFKELGREGVDWMDLTQDRYNWRALVSTLMNISVLLVISDFRREVNGNCDLLGYYAASSDNFLQGIISFSRK